jgi:hypothetical protein
VDPNEPHIVSLDVSSEEDDIHIEIFRKQKDRELLKREEENKKLLE